MEARASSVCVAIRVRIEPSIGPAQGVQIMPKISPKIKPPKFPLPALLESPRALVESGTSFWVRSSNGFGQSIKAPNRIKATTEMFLSVSGAIFRLWTMNERVKPVIENITIKPRAIKSGLVLLFCPTLAPSKIGKRGSMHGAPTVRMPARMANSN